MYPTTIFLQSLLIKYKDDPVRKQIILNFIKIKIDGGNMKQRKYNKKPTICNLFKKNNI